MESCDLCEKNFATKERLKYHMSKSHSQKQKCPFCAIEVKHLKRHLKTVHGDIPKLTCDVCHCTLKGSKALEKHKQDQHSEESQDLVDCDICGKTLLSRTYQRHLKRQHSDNSIVKCDLCFKEFPRQANLNVHIRTVHSDIERKKMKCEKCEQSFLTKSGLKFHFARVHDEKRYPCDLCDKTFTQVNHMKDHRKNKHFGMESRTNCEICSKTFCNPSTFRKHLKIVHQGLNNRNKWPCEQCSKSFSKESELRYHTKSVHENVKYSCDLCGKSFAYESTLMSHRKKQHSGISSELKCEMCGKIITYPSGVILLFGDIYKLTVGVFDVGVHYYQNRFSYPSPDPKPLTPLGITTRKEATAFDCLKN